MTTAKRKFPRRGIFLLPNLFTTAALFAGFYSIVAAVDGNFQNAGVAILVAFVLDGIDGRVARLTNTTTQFGKEYDSLSDMVSFGVAPAVVVYQWGVARLTEWNVAWGRVGWLVAFLFAVAAALRLARFNSQPAGTSKRFFVGLPCPSAAALVAAFVWFSSELELAGLGGLALAFIITLTAGMLMVSRFRYYSFKEVTPGRRIPFTYLIGIVLIFILISLDPPSVFLLLFAVYACSGPIYWLWRKRAARPRQNHAG
jgi:CDP-diacylglycerol--serine O-phosphatidyltransferase